MPDRSLRVATFNIRHGEGADGVVDLHRTTEVIKGLNVDLIALQELDAGVRRSNGIDQPAALADALGMHVFFASAMDLDGGRYGIALAASTEFTAEIKILPRVADEEPRVAIVATWLQIGVVTTHLSRSATARKTQTAYLAELVNQQGRRPVMVLGDLNQRVGDLGPLEAAGLTPVRVRRSFGEVVRFRYRIDHILLSDHLVARNGWVRSTRVSDHDPFGAELISIHA